MAYILLSTLQSTGTWWVIDALRKHPQIGGLSHTSNVMALKNGWVLRDDLTGNPHNEALAPAGFHTLLYEHWEAPDEKFFRWGPQQPTEYLMSVLPTLSPLRDPLACIVRAWHREPPLYPYDWLIDAWEHAAKRGQTLGVNFWRMDPFDKVGFIRALKGATLPAPGPWLNKLTPDVKINSTPKPEMNKLRRLYQSGDKVGMEKMIPKPWRRLREAEPILRPFLEPQGFVNLLWWS